MAIEFYPNSALPEGARAKRTITDRAPTVTDDSAAGYSAWSLWGNSATGEVYRCLDATTGAAVWVQTTLTVDELGSAAMAETTDFATAAQGAKADTALQPTDYGMAPVNSIGVAGTAGYGVGVCPAMPDGFTPLPGTFTVGSDNYGNYQYSDGSIMVWVPAFYYRIGNAASPNYVAYGLNAIDTLPLAAFPDTATANLAGYALHRAFIDGGKEQPGYFRDKYQASDNGGIASSIKNGNPLSSNSAHNPFSLVGAANALYGAIDAAKTRGADFFCSTRFMYAAEALLSIAHGQAATSATYCAWYDATGVTNFPKGNNNNALGDANDSSVSYVSDGYNNCGKTGSGTPFAKTTHNGQACGIADLNGNMWEISLGITRPGATSSDAAQQNDAAAFYVMKESVAVKDLTSGWGAGNDAWGDATHLAALYDPITLSQIDNGIGWQRFGNGANQVLDPAISSDGYRQTGLGIYTLGGHSSVGSNLFGQDGGYEYHRANLCAVSCGNWNDSFNSGPSAFYLFYYRTYSGGHVTFRSALFLS